MTKWAVSILVLAVSLAAGGCASVPRSDTAQHGLLQSSQGSGAAPMPSGNDQVRVGMAISVPGNVVEKSGSGFIWPVKEGQVSSLYGSRKRDYHEGIDIKANRGAPILASRDGEVIYSSRRIHGYGNMIVVKHVEGMATVYAHAKKNLVKVGDHVTQGQVIGYVGSTGKATGPHVHFEIRKNELPQDPLPYLPQVRAPAVANK